MRRRDLLILGGVATAWPWRTRAQQKLPVIGFLSPILGSEDVESGFRKGLSDTGFVAGENVRIEYRRTNGRYDLLPALAVELVRAGVDIIVTQGGPATARAAAAAARDIPIVFGSGDDPVKFGLVPNLNHPGGNMTGVSPNTISLDGKRLALLHEAVPKAKDIAVLMNPAFTDIESHQSEIAKAGEAMGLQLHFAKASSPDDFGSAFETIARAHAEALLVSADPFLASQSRNGGPLLALPREQAFPTMYEWRESVVDGGFVSYGTSLFDIYRQLGIYAGRILKGEKPGDLPVWQPMRFQLVVNLKTAKTLGLAIPPTFLALADEAIE